MTCPPPVVTEDFAGVHIYVDCQPGATCWLATPISIGLAIAGVLAPGYGWVQLPEPAELKPGTFLYLYLPHSPPPTPLRRPAPGSTRTRP